MDATTLAFLFYYISAQNALESLEQLPEATMLAAFERACQLCLNIIVLPLHAAHLTQED